MSNRNIVGAIMLAVFFGLLVWYAIYQAGVVKGLLAVVGAIFLTAFILFAVHLLTDKE